MVLALKKDKRYTYQDYLTWGDDERWEIIDGQVYNMSPALKIKHQDIAGNFYMKLRMLTSNRFYTGIAPTDIVFDDYNVVQPDVFVVCDRSKITESNIQGAPVLIIEVISHSTEIKDKREKKKLYERFGVKEYILIYPDREYMERYHLIDNRYAAPEIFNWDEVLILKSLEIELNLWEIFEKEKRGEGV